MGRKETHYLQTLSCDSMAQQNMKMRPALLKRNSLDSADFMRQSHHRRSKSQQVRFKDDGTMGVTEMDTPPAQGAAFLAANTKINSHPILLPNQSPSFPRAQKGLQNIAIQTSPSLRKHLPVFKKKKLTVSKSLTEMTTEPVYSIQVNGNISEQDIIPSDISYVRITNNLEDRFSRSEVDSQLHQKPTIKSQCNGPTQSDSDNFSVPEKTTVSVQVPEYIHLSFPQDSNASVDALDMTTDLSNSLHSSTVIKQSSENNTPSSNPEKSHPCLRNSSYCTECKPHSDSCDADWELPVAKLPVANKDASSKETTPLSPPPNHHLSPCFLRDYQQTREHETDSNCVTLTNDDHATMSLTSSKASKSIPSRHTEIEKNTQPDISDCNNCIGFHIESYLPRNEINRQTNKEIIEMNQIHLAHGELCALQGRLQSVEESLHSNQEKIKVLLNVIQDLERARALSEGRNFYHTGQDLNNCSTCQNTACIIYSVEYDFRQQEGRFHQILKRLDHVEQSSATASPQKLPPDPPIPEKKESRRKTKKMKKKCFWWI
ncbi:protein INSYN2B [Rhea pennata]|uniref:protein INSYN2B n=1 Tax=Rhea pennata TaxID=8795 RepID=UPI002E274006